MKIGMIGAFIRNFPFGTEIAFKKGLEKNKDVSSIITFDPTRPDLSQWSSSDLDALIVFKNAGEYRSLVDEARLNGTKTIVYQPDDSRAPGIYDMLKEVREYCDYAFTFDSTGAHVAEEIGYKKSKKLLVTADDDIYKPIKCDKDIDFCFVGSYSNPVMHHSRRMMVDILVSNNFKVCVMENAWIPQEINKIYNRSKIVLNHATNVGQEFGYGWGYQCRHFEAAMAKSCLLSNNIIDGEDGPLNFFKFNSQDSLLSKAQFLIENTNIRETVAHSFYNEVMLYHSPENRSEEIVEFIKSL